jgi:hypothetical protein
MEIDDKLKKYLGAGLSEDGLAFTAQFGREVASGTDKITAVTFVEPIIDHVEQVLAIQNPIERTRKLMSLCSNPPVSPEAIKRLPVSEFRKADRFLENFTSAGPETGESS